MIPEKEIRVSELRKKYPGFIARRIVEGKPLVSEAGQKPLLANFARLLSRMTKANQKQEYRHAERLLIIRELSSLWTNPLMVDCMYACLYADDQTLKEVLYLLTDEPSQDEESLSESEVEKTLRNIERLSEGEDDGE